MASALELRCREVVRERVRSGMSADRSRAGEFRADIARLAREACAELGASDPSEIEACCRFVVDDFTGLGPMQVVFDDDRVTEVMVVPGGQAPDGSLKTPSLWAEIGGKTYPMNFVDLISADDVWRVVSRIAEQCGRRCDESSPLLDARLPDGSRVNSVHWAVCPAGPSVNIRKFSRNWLSAEDLAGLGALSRQMLAFLKSAVLARANIVVSGGTGSGKTTLLNALGGFIPADERVITIEDTLEVQLPQPDQINLQARPANIEGAGAVTMHDLLVNTLRMRPDRIIVGECRDAETYEMLQAMQTGHDGSMTTVHANDCAGAFTRIENMVVSSFGNMTSEAIRAQIGSAVDLVVQTRRYRDGSRRISSITSVDGYADGQIRRMELFCYDEAAREFAGCGMQPESLRERMRLAGAEYDASWFFGGGIR